MRRKFTITLLSLGLLSLGACKKLPADGEILENTYNGTLTVTSTGNNRSADFTGTASSGVYKFAWENPNSRADVYFEIDSPTGSVSINLKDEKEKQLLSESLTGDGGFNSFSDVSGEGKAGIWTVTVTISNFTGDGSYSLTPVE